MPRRGIILPVTFGGGARWSGMIPVGYLICDGEQELRPGPGHTAEPLNFPAVDFIRNTSNLLD